MADGTFPRMLPVADRALLVEFGDAVDEAVHRRVLALDRALRAASVPALWKPCPRW
jgi:inhibitor of KinA